MKSLIDFSEEGFRIHRGFILQCRQSVQVAGHDAVLDRLEWTPAPAGRRNLTSSGQMPSSSPRLRSAPDQAKRVATELVEVGSPFRVLIVVALDGAVGRLILIIRRRGRPARRSSWPETAEGGSDHVAHHVAVVVLAGPDITRPPTGRPGRPRRRSGCRNRSMPAASNFSLYSVVVDIPAKISLKRWSYFLEMVSLVANHRSCLVIQGVIETGPRKADDGLVHVVHAPGCTPATLKLVDQSAGVSVPSGRVSRPARPYARARQPAFPRFYRHRRRHDGRW